jgi:uncharacterized membrane protein
MLFAGISHLTVARTEFRAQVPRWVPIDEDTTVVLSGIVEIGVGGALLCLGPWRIPLGFLIAAFFVAIFPGNISQYVNHRDGFGLDSDAKRAARLPLQAVLVTGVLWATGAWRDRARLAK